MVNITTNSLSVADRNGLSSKGKFIHPNSYQEREVLTWKRLAIICLALDASIL